MSRNYYYDYNIRKNIPSVQGEQDIITSHIGSIQKNERIEESDAAGTSWRELTTPNVTIAESVPGWSKILPTPSGYGLQHYNKFFEIYTARIAAPPTYDEKGPVLPARKYVEKWVNNPAWQSAHELDGKGIALRVLDLYDAVEVEASAGCFDGCVEKVFDIFEEMLGIDKRFMPAFAQLATHDSWTTGTATVSGRASFLYDIKDVMLWLYLRTDNARRDEKQRLQDLADAAKLDEFEEAVASDQDTAGGALEVRAAQKVNAKIKSGEELTAAEKELLRALASGNMDFFHNKVRETNECLLRLNLEAISSPYYSPTQGALPYYDRRERPHKSIYQDSMSPATIINKIAYSPNSGPFLEARTHEISQLVPMIRLFKSYYNDDSNDISEEVEFYFDGGVSAEQALEGRTGVGIKSFEWNLNATNPATVRNDITATLTLYFQGFKELSAERWGREIIHGTPKKFQYQDLLIRQQRNATTTNESAPLPGATICSDRDDSIYDSRFYEIKALVGWAPTSYLEGDKTEEYEKDDGTKGTYSPLIKSIRSQQIPLFLTLIDHEFSFTQEGTFELQITYRARMEAINSDPRLDVLTTPTRKETVNALQKEISAARKNCDSKESIQDLKDKVAVTREADRDLLASSIMRGLEPYIYITEFDTEEIHNALLGVDASAASAATIKALAVTRAQISANITKRDQDQIDSIMGQLKKLQVESSGQGTRKQRDEAEKAVSSGDKTKDLTDIEGLSDPKLTVIPWFYFGDLVDIVVSHAIDNNTVGGKKAPGIIPGIELDNLVYLMGTYNYTAVGKYSTVSNPGSPVSILVPSEIERKIGQLSSVPVTVAAYNKWFIRNVVNAERSTFPLVEFLRSFIQQVIIPFLNRKCFDTDPFKKLWSASPDKSWVEIAPLISKSAAISLPPAQGGNPLELFRTYPTTLHPAYDKVISSSEINLRKFSPPDTGAGPDFNGLIPTRRKDSHSQTIRDSYHLSVFYLVGQDSYKELGPPTGEGDRETRDLKKGIYHLYLGADSGLVKEVTFSKVDAPYLREARIQQDSLNPLAQLAATYNVNLKMVGNTIFWPGQYIFVNPVGFGTGMPSQVGSISNQLGLGGYHLVTDVKSFVEDGKYETTVKGLFEFSGDGCPSLPQSTPVDPCDPDSDPGATTEQDGPEVAPSWW